jgi:Uma2 family endonuclease
MASGPFLVDQIKAGDRYELSDGHPIYCAPGGGDHASLNTVGAMVIASDPDLESAGIDAGFTIDEKTVRAPDVSVGVPDAPGWIKGVPPLAIEYVARGQDLDKLKQKIRDLLNAGTKWVWVVRLEGPRHVEVHEKGRRVRKKNLGEVLAAPGVLRNPVPVEALFDPHAAQQVTLRNLLQREGYGSLDEVREEGREEGREQTTRSAILTVLASRGISVSKKTRTQITNQRDTELLDRWLERAATAPTEADVFDR